MNINTIRKTAVCRFDKDEGIYIVESPLLPIASGVDSDPNQAWEIFDDLLNSLYIKYLEGKQVAQYGKRGRPAKGGVALNCVVKPATKTALEELANELNCSQGEAVDYLLAFHMGVVSIPSVVASDNVARLSGQQKISGQYAPEYKQTSIVAEKTQFRQIQRKR